MSLFKEISKNEHEQVIYCYDKISGLKAIIAIHNTMLGPSLGGCRMLSYDNDDEALIDVLRLSRGMTYKASIAGLNLGGGKSVIINNPKTINTRALFKTFGKFVQSLGGRYITAEDVGTTVDDMEAVHTETNFVTGLKYELGGSGNPAPVTAFGVYHGMKASIKKLTGNDSLTKKRITIQGLGHVGFNLIKYLMAEKAIIIASDINHDNIRKTINSYPSIQIIQHDMIYRTESDIFAPCALGGVINDNTIPYLKCAIIAGCANNILEDEDKHATQLYNKNILYAPDFVISAGGLINVANELEGYNKNKALKQTEKIFDTVYKIFTISSKNHVNTLTTAKTLALSRINKIKSKKIFINNAV